MREQGNIRLANRRTNVDGGELVIDMPLSKPLYWLVNLGFFQFCVDVAWLNEGMPYQHYAESIG
jgi:hypothetical protein